MDRRSPGLEHSRRGARRRPWAALFLAAGGWLPASVPASLAAQVQPPSPPAAYRGVLVGARLGINYLFEGLVVGGQTHFLVDPWGRVALIPNAEVEFRRGITDWQANLDAAVMPLPGIYVGGGMAWRNTIYPDQEDRETKSGYSILAGLRPPPQPGDPGFHLDLRWTVVGGIRPRTATFGVSWPLLLLR